jgi:hypothetical protein
MKFLSYLFFWVAFSLSVLAQDKIVYKQTDHTISVADEDVMITFADVKSKDVTVYVAPPTGRIQFKTGDKIYFSALTDKTIKISAIKGAALISPDNSFTVSGYGSQWQLLHLGKNIWLASGDLYSLEVDAYLNQDITLRARVDSQATGPFTFVWRKNQTIIRNAIGPTLKLERLKLSDAGIYTVTVSNSAGVVSSEGMQLIVR